MQVKKQKLDEAVKDRQFCLEKIRDELKFKYNQNNSNLQDMAQQYMNMIKNEIRNDMEDDIQVEQTQLRLTS